jgi:hypothetical protein
MMGGCGIGFFLSDHFLQDPSRSIVPFKTEFVSVHNYPKELTWNLVENFRYGGYSVADAPLRCTIEIFL